MLNRDKKYIKLLEQIVEGSEKFAQARVAAMIVYKNSPISVGNNRSKSHPFQLKFSKNDEAIYFHAETDAIHKALRVIPEEDLKFCTIYICRIKHDGTLGIAKPCVGCQKAIEFYGIKRVIYSLDTGEYEITQREYV